MIGYLRFFYNVNLITSTSTIYVPRQFKHYISSNCLSSLTRKLISVSPWMMTWKWRQDILSGTRIQLKYIKYFVMSHTMWCAWIPLSNQYIWVLTIQHDTLHIPRRHLKTRKSCTKIILICVLLAFKPNMTKPTFWIYICHSCP